MHQIKKMRHTFFQPGLQEGGDSGKKAAYKTQIKGDKIDNDYSSGIRWDGLKVKTKTKNPKTKQDGGGRGPRAAAAG